MRDADPRTDIGVALLLISICGAVLWETRDIPPGTFEPLGSAPVPQVTALLIIVLCLLVLLRAIRRLRQGWTSGQDAASHRLDAAVVAGFTVLYVMAMQWRIVTFAVMTTLFLCLSIGWLVRFERRRLLIVALVAAATGFGCQYLFTRVFIVDLPGL